MSWFGVDLNGSLSSIKGQISSFTRDVLADEEEVRDDNSEILIPKKRLKEYEKAVLLYQEEINELKASKLESEARLQALDYNYLQKLELLKRQLSEAQAESDKWRNNNPPDEGWEWNLDEGRPPAVNEAVYKEKIAQLQKELTEERRRRRDDDDDDEGQLPPQDRSKSLPDYQAPRRPSHEDGRPTTTTTSPTYFTNVSLRGEDADDEAPLQILHAKLVALTTEFEALKQERDELKVSLVDLDNQHQLVIDEVLKSKKLLAEDLRRAKEEITELNASRPPEERDGANGGSPESQSRVEQEEDNARLKDDLVAKLEEEKRKRRESDAEVRRLSKAVEEVKQVQNKKLQDAERRVADVSSLQLQVLALKSESEQRAGLVAELNDKIVRQEEEILKLEAVLEEKNMENVNAFHRLRQHEEIARLAIREVKEENDELKKDAAFRQEASEAEAKAKEEEEEEENSTIAAQLVSKLNVQSLREVVENVDELQSEVASLRCERDRLSEDLRQVQDLYENVEADKSQLERDCEDLRDQVEELQCGTSGGRMSPEGSLTPRALPTIEEEEPDNNNSHQFAEGCGAAAPAPAAASEEDSKSSASAAESSWKEKISQLEAEISALREARQNLEMELSLVKGEKEEMERRLTEANSQLGNLSNLEVEAVTLRSENESLQGRLNDGGRGGDCCREKEQLRVALERRVEEMTNALDKMSFDVTLQSSREAETKAELQKALAELNAQNKLIHEYRHEISHLQNNSTLVQQFQNRLSSMEGELDKAKGLVIYKDDQIDQLKQGIDQIGEIFDLEAANDLRQTYMGIRREYSSLRKELDEAAVELESAQEENERLVSDAKDKEQQIATLRAELESSFGASRGRSEGLQQEEYEAKLREKEALLQNLEDEKNSHLTKINDLEKKCEVLNSRIQSLEEISAEGLRMREEELSGRESEDLQMREKLRRDYEAKLEERESRLRVLEEEKETSSAMLAERESRLQALQGEKNTLSTKIEDLRETFRSLEDSSHNYAKELQKKEEENLRLNSELEEMDGRVRSLEEQSAAKDLQVEELRTRLSSTQAASDAEQKLIALERQQQGLEQELRSLREERQQMVLTSTQKHQEAITYYNEIQRLNEVMKAEEARMNSTIASLDERLKEASELKEKLLAEKGELSKEVSQRRTEVKRLEEEVSRRESEVLQERETTKIVTKERDQLRIANSSFNSQYEEKSKEASALQEKENHLRQEVQRLKQHLLEVEETYTSEAVKSEQRETSLRHSLAKMQEKFASSSTHYSNTNQKTAAQLESLQERLDEAVLERDEARERVRTQDEALLQNEEALNRLQQVLQDFQKSQAKDISSATERERRRYEEERGRKVALEADLSRMQDKLREAEARLERMDALQLELGAKETVILDLKARVNAVTLSAKKTQDQIAALQSSSEAKVDKHLLRNLIVGYFATPSDKRGEVLRIVAQVLDFSTEERSRAGLDQQPGSWLSSIANFLAPPPSNIRVASKVDLLDHSSLSQAFIRFLEEESAPRAQLPALQMAEETKQKAQKKAQVKANTFVSPDWDAVTVLPSGDGDAPAASDEPQQSAATNQLLLSSAAVPSSSFPLISPPSSSPTTPVLPSESTSKYLNNLLNVVVVVKDENGSTS